MKYENVKSGVFIKRTNRFVAEVLVDGNVEICHVKNTGRLRELLYEGVRVVVNEPRKGGRKTRFDLIGVYKGDVLYNIDSNAPNVVFGEFIGNLFSDVKIVKAEKKYKNSRFDYYVEYGDKKAFIEVKGVTKEVDGVMMFPDAPTQRGVKHVKELCECIKDGYEAYLVFIIQADFGECFAPDEKSHREFKEVLDTAREMGVNILAYRCRIGEDMLEIKNVISQKTADCNLEKKPVY